MVYGTYNELVTGAYKPTNITGGPHIVGVIKRNTGYITAKWSPKGHRIVTTFSDPLTQYTLAFSASELQVSARCLDQMNLNWWDMNHGQKIVCIYIIYIYVYI